MTLKDIMDELNINAEKFNLDKLDMQADSLLFKGLIFLMLNIIQHIR